MVTHEKLNIVLYQNISYNFFLVKVEPLNAGMGISSLSARVGGMVAPYIVLLGDQNVSLPMFAFACTALFAAIAGLRLHETKGKPMPETFEDLEGSHPRRGKTNGDA